MLTERMVRVSDHPAVELFVLSTDGPAERTLLVVHGGPDWDHSYLVDPLVRLAGDHRVVWVDLRGCGRSTRGLADAQYNPDAVVADLTVLLDELGPVDLLGFSYGGLVVQRLALAAPDRVRRLVIASSSVPPVRADAFHGWAERDRRLAMSGTADAALTGADFTRADAIASAPANVWQLAKLPGYLDRLARVRFAGEWLRPWQAGTLPSARPDDAMARLDALGVPVLLLHGRQDMTFPVALAEQAASELAAARAVVLDDAGHMAHVDQPERWLVALRDFLC